MMSEKKFKVGDRVRIKGRTCISTVMYMKDGWVSVDTPIRTAESYPEDDVEYVDPRTAFLQELRELLAKYNAEIQADKGCFDVSIGGKYALTIEGNDDYSITANNIMNC